MAQLEEIWEMQPIGAYSFIAIVECVEKMYIYSHVFNTFRIGLNDATHVLAFQASK